MLVAVRGVEIFDHIARTREDRNKTDPVGNTMTITQLRCHFRSLNASRIAKLIAVAAFATTMMIAESSISYDGHGATDSHAGGHFTPKKDAPLTNRSNAYSGSSPIDMTNGLGFNNGTFGQPNSEYEKWAQSSTWAVSLAERPYSFDQKDRFIKTLDERIVHFEHAVWNWARVTEITKPEVKEYAEKATADIKPRMERARQAWRTAKSSGKSDWERNQDEAKRAFQELQSFYASLHKNVR